MGGRSSKSARGRLSDLHSQNEHSPEQHKPRYVTGGFQRSKSRSAFFKKSPRVKGVVCGKTQNNCDIIRTPPFVRLGENSGCSSSHKKLQKTLSEQLLLSGGSAEKIPWETFDPFWDVSTNNCQGSVPGTENGLHRQYPVPAPTHGGACAELKYADKSAELQTEEWYFGKLSRTEAETILMSNENLRGTFLVRDSEQNPGDFSVSVKDWEPERWFHVKHYKIRTRPFGGHGQFGSGCYYISPKCVYLSLRELVQAYSRSAHGLCYALTRPCQKAKPKQTQSYDQVWDPFLSASHEKENNSTAIIDEWEINRNELQFGRKLGSGHFGEVWFGHWRNRMEVAIKTLKTDSIMSSSAFLEEAGMMKKFRHSNIVMLYAVCSGSGEEPIFIVTEFMRNGSLLEYLRNGDGRQLDEADLVYIASQIGSGMAYLEEKQLVHRDLAARNVLIGENNIAKICDFGFARIIVQDGEYCPRQGSRFPVKWTAPDAMQYMRFTVKSDVWSYGILLMELFTYGQVPYPGMSNRDVQDQVCRGYRMPQPMTGHVSDSVYNIMLRCWDAVPTRRPTFKFLHLFFQDFPNSSKSSNNYRISPLPIPVHELGSGQNDIEVVTIE